MFRPKGIAEDSEGHVYVVDGMWGVVQVFDRGGQLLYYLEAGGQGWESFNCLQVCLLTETTVSTLWTLTTGGFRCFDTMERQSRWGSSAVNKILLLCAFSIVLSAAVQAQVPTTNVLGVHDMGPNGTSPTRGSLTGCQYCHATHSGLHKAPGPLWSQKLSTATNYTPYSSTTMANAPQVPTANSSSILCLSCHDGTVAPGQNTPYGSIRMGGSMSSSDVFGTNLSGGHPFNFKLTGGHLQSSGNLLPSLSSGSTGNRAVKLVRGNVQCTSCHNPHVQSIDPVAQNFLVINNANSALCLACHVSDPSAQASSAKSPLVRAGGPRATSVSPSGTQTFNGLSAWSRSAHAQSVYKVAKA